MADILSQEEIDALLSATDGDDGGGGGDGGQYRGSHAQPVQEPRSPLGVIHQGVDRDGCVDNGAGPLNRGQSSRGGGI